MQTAAKVAIAVIMIVVLVIIVVMLKPAAPATTTVPPPPPQQFAEHAVVQCMQNGAIYLIEGGKKRHFSPAGYAANPWPAPTQYTDCTALMAIPDGVDI